MEDTIWVLIPLAPFILGGFAIWAHHQRKLAELQIEAAADKAARYSTTVAHLEERMQVLERIITDGGYDTAVQIEALRDRREVEESREPLETRQ